MAQTERGAYLENIAFRFFNSPTLYGLSLREFGSAVEPALDPEHDFALLQTVGAPEMRQPEGAVPRLGTMRLNEDLYAVTTDIFLRIAADVRSGAKLDLPGRSVFNHSILCRPAHIAPMACSCMPVRWNRW